MKYRVSNFLMAVVAVIVLGAESVLAQSPASGTSAPILKVSQGRASATSSARHLIVAPPAVHNATAGSDSDNHSGAGEWIFPGEYESHQAMWMLWPVYENKAGFPSTEPITEMIRAMSGHVHVNLAVQDASEEASVSSLLTTNGVPLEHVHFFQLEHADIWTRDMGPAFTRSLAGKLRINDWNFNYWGAEEPDSDNSTFSEAFDRTVASVIKVPILSARVGPGGVRMIHEGGSVTHNGQGTMVAVESVVIQRNVGPGRFCGGQAPVTDYSQPNTYAPNPDWPACKALVENEYRRMLGVKKVIWVPTGIVEDNATFRGPQATHIHVPTFDGFDIPHSGVYTLFTTNGHSDDFIRFVSHNTIVLAQEMLPRTPARTPVERLTRWLQEQNRERLERAYDIVSHETTASGEPIRVVRIPTPALTLEVFQEGDGTYDYYAAYDRWEDGSTLPEFMLGVWPGSYVNYVPTNDLVLVSKFWKPGRPHESKERDDRALEVLKELFPGRRVVQVFSENVNRGGGGMNCITQQQPASSKFAERCGWAKVKVDVQETPLYRESNGSDRLGIVPRLSSGDNNVYLRRLSSSGNRVRVQVVGAIRLDGELGWVDEDDIESAGEKCLRVYSPN